MTCYRRLVVLFKINEHVTSSVKQFKRNITVSADFDQVPSVKGLPIIGNTLALIAAGGAKNLHKFIDKRHRKLGPVFKENVGPVTAVFLSDPSDMRNVFAKEGKCPVHIKPESWVLYNEKYGCSRGLFFMDGDEWLHCRRIMNNLLLKGPMEWLENCCDAASDFFVKKISKYEDTEFPNLEAELYKWSVDIVICVLLGNDKFRNVYDKMEPSSKKLAACVNRIFETTGKLQLVSAKLAERLNIPRWRKFENAMRSALTAAQETLDEIKMHSPNNGLLYKMKQENLTEQQIDKIIIDLLLGASDTTANTMSWMFYLLSKNRNIQQKLRSELEVDQKTSYSNQIVRESMRLYPAAPFITRFMPESVTVSGYVIPKDTLIVMSIYSSGRDERYFVKPDTFLPERWDRDSALRTPVQHLGSLPFGLGLRACIGKRIANFQLNIALSKIVSKYNINVINHSEINDILEMIAKPSVPLRLILTKY